MPLQPWAGEMMLVSFGFVPKGWAPCDGAVYPISKFPNLAKLLGKTFGGDGVTTFGVPNLAGVVPVSAGQGPGMQNYTLGQQGGASALTLRASQIPSHTHPVASNSQEAQTGAPDGAFPGVASAPLYAPQSDGTAMAAGTLAPVGSASPYPVQNMQPYLALQWAISLNGDLPFDAD